MADQLKAFLQSLALRPVNPNLRRASAMTMVPGFTSPDLIAPGNIDIAHRPLVWNPEVRGMSSVWSMGIDDRGKEVLIPRVSEDGRILTEKMAYDLYRRTGRHLGMFKSIPAANEYADLLHRQQEAMSK